MCKCAVPQFLKELWPFETDICTKYFVFTTPPIPTMRGVGGFQRNFGNAVYKFLKEL
jgi:hypothetical protein